MKRYRLGEIKLNYDEPVANVPKALAKALRKFGKGIAPKNVEIIRESIDARKKPRVFKVYTVDFDCERELKLPEAPDMSYREVPEGGGLLRHRPVIVGFGPCGMFAALTLAKRGYSPLVIERGKKVEDRVKAVEHFWKTGELDPECNVQFGEGGAGTFSDGKLTTGIKDQRIRYVLEEFVSAGADPAILYEQKPHIGTDVLRTVVKNIRKKIESLGGEIRFGTRLERIIFEDNEVREIEVSRVGGSGETDRLTEIIDTENVILAVGHSSRDTFRQLFAEGIDMEQKPFSIGVRIEHPQSVIDASQYGREAAESGKLPPAAYKLSTHLENGRGVYSFCMCPGGEVVDASSEPGRLVINGMSNRGRDSGTANSGLLVDVRPTDFDDPEDPLSGIAFQEKYERLAYLNGRGKIPKTTWKEFRTAMAEGAAPGCCLGEKSGIIKDKAGERREGAEAVIASLPGFCAESLFEAVPILGKKLRGFDSGDAVIKAVETRSSSPVRIIRDRETMMSRVRGLYPGGEGAGYAGGITSSACDGIKLAEKIIMRYKAR